MTAAAHGRSASGLHFAGSPAPPDARQTTVVQGAASTAARSRSWSAYTFMAFATIAVGWQRFESG